MYAVVANETSCGCKDSECPAEVSLSLLAGNQQFHIACRIIKGQGQFCASQRCLLDFHCTVLIFSVFFFSLHATGLQKSHKYTFFWSSQDGSSKPIFYLPLNAAAEIDLLFSIQMFLALQIILAMFLLFSLKDCFNGSKGWSHWALMLPKSAISMDLICIKKTKQNKMCVSCATPAESEDKTSFEEPKTRRIVMLYLCSRMECLKGLILPLLKLYVTWKWFKKKKKQFQVHSNVPHSFRCC